MTAFAAPRRPLPASPSAAPAAADLEALLADLIAHHEKMLSLAKEHESALRRADAPGVARALAAQQQAGRTLIDLEARRARLTAALAPGLAPAAGPPAHRTANAKVTLSSLAALVPEPARTRVTALAARLRALLAALDAQQKVVLEASRTLLGHMQGLMAQVARSLTHAGTYARPGAMPVSATAVVHSGLDVKS